MLVFIKGFRSSQPQGVVKRVETGELVAGDPLTWSRLGLRVGLV